VGTGLEVAGRIQSRKYIKLESGFSVEKTAFEVSVINLCQAREGMDKSH